MENRQRSSIGRRAAIEMAADTLGGKRDGSQWILDFMGDSARHFTPCGLLLRLEQVRQILKDQNVAQPLTSMLQCSHGNGGVESRGMQRHFELGGSCTHAVGASQQRLQVFQNLLWEHVTQRGSDSDIRSGGFSSGRIEHAKQGVVYMRNATSGV